jgi:hypothetical protein
MSQPITNVITSTRDLSERGVEQILNAFERAITLEAKGLRTVEGGKPRCIPVQMQWDIPVPEKWFSIASDNGVKMEVRITQESITVILQRP